MGTVGTRLQAVSLEEYKGSTMYPLMVMFQIVGAHACAHTHTHTHTHRHVHCKSFCFDTKKKQMVAVKYNRIFYCL